MKNLFVVFLVLFSLTAYAEEMPADVFEKVKANIEAQYPNDFSTQKLLIDGQKKSYEFLSSYVPESMPPDVFAKVKADVEARYPNDFSVQKLLIQGQVKSYNELNK